MKRTLAPTSRSRRVFAGAAFASLLRCGGPSAPTVAPPSPPQTAPVASSDAASPSGAPSVVEVACGDFHTCALMSDKSVRCWGRNKSGELGDGTTSDRTTPARVMGLGPAVQIALGMNFTCARLEGGTVSCWGTGRILGDGALRERIPPTVVPGVSAIVDLHAGGFFTCARNAAGDVRCWGLDAKAGTSASKVKSMSVAGAHACGRIEGDLARCWGEGIWDPSASPTFGKPAITGVAQIDTGDSFACAVGTTGQVWCWGRNDEGELGTQPDEDNHADAQLVPGLPKVVSISSTESHTCAVTGDAKVVCWGSNTEGELGRGMTSTSEVPAIVTGLAQVEEVDIGADHGCARTKGDLYCWGANRSGQLGDGTTTQRTTPVKVLWK